MSKPITDEALKAALRWASGHGAENGGWHVEALLREVGRLRLENERLQKELALHQGDARDDALWQDEGGWK